MPTGDASRGCNSLSNCLFLTRYTFDNYGVTTTGEPGLPPGPIEARTRFEPLMLPGSLQGAYPPGTQGYPDVGP